MNKRNAVTHSDLKYSRAKQQCARLNRQGDSIPENEWNFFGPGMPRPPDWQMNHWLNYEYARSYRPMVEAVLKLRKEKPRSREEGTWPAPLKVPRFAVYLAREYLEFPAQPWLEISEKQREQHVFKAGDNAYEDPFEDDVIRFHDAFQFARDIAVGAASLDPLKAADQDFAVLEINYSKGSRRIVNKFRQWLKTRQAELIKRYENSFLPIHGSQDTFCLADRFRSAQGRGNVGQRNNKRQYEAHLKRLAGLRLLEHYRDYPTPHGYCAEETQRVLVDPLFADEQTAWDRCLAAAKMMKWLAVLWEVNFFPPFGLRHEDFDGTILMPKLITIFPKDKTTKTKPRSRLGFAAKLKAELQGDFLSYETRQQLLEKPSATAVSKK